MDQIWEGVSNDDILVKEDSLNESAFGENPLRVHVYNIPREGLTELNFLNLAKSFLQVHTYFDKPNTTAIGTSEVVNEAKQDLDEPKQDAEESKQSTDKLELFDVYLVAPPQRWARILDQKLCFLSLYTQGHFYHITTEATSEGPRIDLGDIDLVHWRPFDRKISREPFTAYHIGKTDYVPDQIQQIAKWVITKIDCIGSFALNHGNFVSGLGARILCGRRETTVLLGDLFSIADFADSLERRIPTPSGFATGMQLARPNEDVDTWLQRWRLNYRVETDSRGLSLCWKKGAQGSINWKTHEYHHFLRPLAVMAPGLLKPLAMASRVIPALSTALPPPSHHGMCVAAICCLKMGKYKVQTLRTHAEFLAGAQVPDLLTLKSFFGNLYYISARVPLTYDGNSILFLPSI